MDTEIEITNHMGGFVAHSRFVVGNSLEGPTAAFRDQPRLVEEAPGYLRTDVIGPVKAASEIWLLTFWIDESSFQTRRRGHQCSQSRRGIPNGLKRVARETRISHLQLVSS
jgi:heme-degrading monooxygenase HmoA